MKYKISNLYIEIDSDSIPIGIVLGEEDKPESPYHTGYITISEYERGLKDFIYGQQRIHDCLYHYLGKYSTSGEPKPIKKKWVDELVRRGYNVDKVMFDIQTD